MFIPTKAFADENLKTFAPNAGIDYAKYRNFDYGPDAVASVSRLSPYIRRRVLPEIEVIKTTLAHHSRQDAAKFLDEVFWRAYWKGWLEMRPQIWDQYQSDLRSRMNDLQTQSGLRQKWRDACMGATGIDGFDHWARELVQTGYLHNHARMWFASIWIYTLNLPWELGADFFLRHLLDGDPASNTLSWRWVAGQHTSGKAYLATQSNIAKFTNNRFAPDGLAQHLPPLCDFDVPAISPIQWPRPVGHIKGKVGYLIHDDDLNLQPEFATSPVAYFKSTHALSPMDVSDQLLSFVDGLFHDHKTRSKRNDAPIFDTENDVLNWAMENGLTHILTPVAPVGPNQKFLKSIDNALLQKGTELCQIANPYDRMTWPKATHGFFKFKNNIEFFLDEIEKGRCD